jgi:hypothetical protein
MFVLPLGSGKGRPLTSTGETATALAASLEETRVGGPAQAVAGYFRPVASYAQVSLLYSSHGCGYVYWSFNTYVKYGCRCLLRCNL